jgi:putative membrane protein
MGAADAVPGVSGGTIALITGIYGRLIAAVTDITPERVGRVLAAPLPGRRADALAALREMDAGFLAVLVAGVLTAVVIATRVLARALAAYPVVTFGLFFGLIGASAVVLARDVSVDTPGRGGAAALGFLLAFVGSGRASAALGTGPVATALAGAVAVSAMILPGISGSLLLLVLGQYERMVDTLRRFVDALIALPRDGAAPVVDPGVTVVVFVLGGLVGLTTIAHGIRHALNRRPEATMAFLVSLVVGALRAPVVRAGEDLPGGWTADHVAAFAVAALVGAAVVALVDRTT